jgi:hypothetical protein
MSIERFPMRHAVCVWVLRDEDGWLVLARDHGWTHGNYYSAMADASWMSQNLAMPIRIRRAAPV